MTLSNYGKCLRTTPLYMTEVNYKLDVSFLCLTFVSVTLTFTNSPICLRSLSATLHHNGEPVCQVFLMHDKITGQVNFIPYDLYPLGVTLTMDLLSFLKNG